MSARAWPPKSRICPTTSRRRSPSRRTSTSKRGFSGGRLLSSRRSLRTPISWRCTGSCGRSPNPSSRTFTRGLTARSRTSTPTRSRRALRTLSATSTSSPKPSRAPPGGRSFRARWRWPRRRWRSWSRSRSTYPSSSPCATPDFATVTGQPCRTSSASWVGSSRRMTTRPCSASSRRGYMSTRPCWPRRPTSRRASGRSRKRWIR
mmetsp:Transcript_30417/g.76139  ORF Transcript_30417/g.76139 Transcript_30417/m.76139 type:complete len:205 (-) Transcript_30417:1181-1795(-)